MPPLPRCRLRCPTTPTAACAPTPKRAVPPQVLLDAAISVERDLSILTGEELLAKYSTDDLRLVFKHVTGKSVEELAPEHKPFWHYILQTWYKKPAYRALLYAPRHRDEVARAVLLMATGK